VRCGARYRAWYRWGRRDRYQAAGFLADRARAKRLRAATVETFLERRGLASDFYGAEERAA